MGPDRLEDADPPDRAVPDGHQPEVVALGRPARPHGGRLALVERRQRQRRGHHRQRPRRREALPLEHADLDAAVPALPPGRAVHAGAARRRPGADRRRGPDGLQGRHVRDHRGHHARRAGQRRGRPHRQRAQPARPQLHDRRRVRLRSGCGEQRDPRPAGPPVRRGRHRRDRPEHGRRRVRQVLQDRGAVGDRHPPVRRGRRRIRHGRGRGPVRPQAPRRRRARRQHDLRDDPRGRRVLRRQGQGHHRAQPGRPATRRGPWLGTGRGRPGHRLGHRGARDLDPRRRCRRARDPHQGLRRRRCPETLHRPGVGEVQHRPPQGRRRRRRAVQDGPVAAREGPRAVAELRQPQRQRRLGQRVLLRQHRAARVGPAGQWRASSRWGQRLRLRRHELPRRLRGARARPLPAHSPHVRRPGGRTRVEHAHVCRGAGRRGSHCDRARRSDRAGGAQDPAARRPGPRWPGRGRPARPGTDRAGRGQGRQRTGPRRPGPGAGRSTRAHRRRLWRCGRARRQAREARHGPVHRQPRDLQDAAAAGRVPRSRAGAQGRLPLHRPGLAVRQHAPLALRPRTARQGDLRRRGPRDDPTAGAPADLVHLRRPDRRGGGEDRDRPAHADRDHPARGARDRPVPHPALRGIRHQTRHGHGTQPRRVRRPRRRAHADVRRRSRSRERPGPRDGQRLRRGQRRDGRGVRAVVGDREGRRRGRRLRRHREHQLLLAGRRRWRHPSRREDHRDLRRPGHAGGPHSGEPRVPHGDRRAGLAALRHGVAPPGHASPAAADRRQRDRPVLPDERRHRVHARLRRQADRLARAVRQGPADPLRRRGPGVRRDGPEEGPHRLRRGRPGQPPRRRHGAVHQPPQARRRRRGQPGPLRAVCRGPRLRHAGHGGRARRPGRDTRPGSGPCGHCPHPVGAGRRGTGDPCRLAGRAGSHRSRALPRGHHRTRPDVRRRAHQGDGAGRRCTRSGDAGRGRDPRAGPCPQPGRAGPGAARHHRCGARAARCRQHLRRREHRPHPRRRGPHPTAAHVDPRTPGRHADHPAGQGRQRRRVVPGHRQPRRRHQARRTARADQPRRPVRYRLGARRGPRLVDPDGHRRGDRRDA